MSQSESMQDTQKVVEEVVAQIANSMQSIQQIKETTEHLANVRNEVLQAVETLSNIAQDSVSGTKKTYEDTEEVVDTFKQVYMLSLIHIWQRQRFFPGKMACLMV